MEKVLLKLFGIGLMFLIYYLINKSNQKKTVSIERKELIKTSLKKYKGEYGLIILWGTILAIISSIIIDDFHIYIFSNDVSGTDLLIIWFVVFFPVSLGILIYRNFKVRRLISDDSNIFAEQTENSVVLKINDESFEIPHLLLPISKEEYVRIINEKKTNKKNTISSPIKPKDGAGLR